MDPAENIFNGLLSWWFWYSTINIFCKNWVVRPIFGTGPFHSFMLNVYCMYNTSVFMATFCLHSSWGYQTCNHLCCYIFSWGENPVCSVSSSSKAEGLEKSCSLLPQRQYYSVIALAAHWRNPHMLRAPCQQHCISHGSGHGSCFPSLLRILSSMLVEWWGRDRVHSLLWISTICIFSFDMLWHILNI